MEPGQSERTTRGKTRDERVNQVKKIDAGVAGEWNRHWPLPIAAALGYSISVLHLYAIGPFIEPIQHAFGWSRTQVSSGITIVGIVGALLSVPVGMLVDRLGPRVIGVTGAVAMVTTFALLGTATGSLSNWILLWALVAAGNLGLQATVLTSAVASRFEQSRGLAFALTLSGGSIGAMVFPLLATWLLYAYGWRTGLMAVGAIWGLVTVPLIWLFFRGGHDGPRPVADKDARNDLTGLSVGEGLRSATFHKLVLASGLLTFTNMGLIVHFVPVLIERGADPLGAAGIASIVGVFSLIGRLGTGLLLDRLPGNLVGAGMFCLPILACSLLLLAGHAPLSQGLAAACFGITVGAEVDVVAYLASRHFGLRNYGILFGTIISALTTGVALGPLAASWMFDQFGSYDHFLGLTIGGMVVSSVALGTIPRSPRFAQTRGDIAGMET